MYRGISLTSCCPPIWPSCAWTTNREVHGQTVTHKSVKTCLHKWILISVEHYRSSHVGGQHDIKWNRSIHSDAGDNMDDSRAMIWNDPCAIHEWGKDPLKNVHLRIKTVTAVLHAGTPRIKILDDPWMCESPLSDKCKWSQCALNKGPEQLRSLASDRIAIESHWSATDGKDIPQLCLVRHLATQQLVTTITFRVWEHLRKSLKKSESLK